MTWTILIHRRADRELRRLPRDVFSRVNAAFDRIAEDPYQGEKVVGYDRYKWRVGQWRIIYEIHEDVLRVLVIDFGARGEIYRRQSRY